MASKPAENFERHARICRELSGATRVSIIQMLGHGPLSVAEMAKTLGLHPAGVTQQLAKLGAAGFVEREIIGEKAKDDFWSVKNPQLRELVTGVSDVASKEGKYRAHEVFSALSSPHIFGFIHKVANEGKAELSIAEYPSGIDKFYIPLTKLTFMGLVNRRFPKEKVTGRPYTTYRANGDALKKIVDAVSKAADLKK